jgi:hypothetical protein
VPFRLALPTRIETTARPSLPGLFVASLAALALIGFFVSLPKKFLENGTFDSLIADFGFANWLFTYEHGFVRRAFVGQLTHALFGDLSYQREFIGKAALALNLFFIACALAFSTDFLRKVPSVGSMIFCAAFISYTGGIPFLGTEIGRTDVFLGVLLLAFYFVSRLSFVTPPAAAMLGAALSCVGMLIHEIWLFMFFPILVSIFIINYSARNIGIPLILTPTILLAGSIYAWGDLSPAQVDGYYAHLLERSGFSDTYPNTRVDGFYASVKALSAGWLPQARDMFLSLDGLKRLLSGLLVLWPIIGYWCLFWISTRRNPLPFPSVFVVAAPLVTCALLPIAMDYSRYLAWMTWNMLFLVAAITERYPTHTGNFVSSAESAGSLLFAWGWSSLTGPLNYWHGAPSNVRALFHLR